MSLADRTDLTVHRYDQHDVRLGRHVVHDPRSRNYPIRAALAGAPQTVAAFRHKVYSPRPLPSQQIGCCTGVSEAVQADTAGNRIKGVTLGMDDAVTCYSGATRLDPFKGEYPPDDTGSSGTAAAQAAIDLGWSTRYEWAFNGTEQILAALHDRPVSVGTRWDNRMFRPDPVTHMIEPGGGVAGGHQWTLIGWDPKADAFWGICWWGDGFGLNGMFRIRRTHLGELLADQGDAHVSYRKLK